MDRSTRGRGAVAVKLDKTLLGTPLKTPDGRYIVVRGRLWRTSNPGLDADERERLVADLMAARRAVRSAGDGDAAKKAARGRVDAAKRGLGERGPVWWTNGAPDLNRHLVKNTSYAAWYETLDELS